MECTTAQHVKWLSLQKALKNIALSNDSPIALEKTYAEINMTIGSCHELAINVLPDLASLTPLDTFASRIMPPKEYTNYHLAFAFFTKLGFHIRFMLDSPTFAAKAPTARQGLALVETADASGWEMLLSLLSHCFPHLGALSCNPQSLIDTLLLTNGDDVYEFMTKALNVERTIQIGKMRPSPNSLIMQVIDQLCQSPDHKAAISDIKLDFVKHVRTQTINEQYLKHTAKSIQ